MLTFGETKEAKEKFYEAKRTINIWDVNVDNIVISKLVETKTNSKYLTEYLDKFVRPLVLVLPKINMLRHLKLKIKAKVKTIN